VERGQREREVREGLRGDKEIGEEERGDAGQRETRRRSKLWKIEKNLRERE
jgi:hypothetical protein